MSIAKIQKGDKVKVIAGNYRGIIGVVTKIHKKNLRDKRISTRASITNIPTIVKYKKSTTQMGQSVPGTMNQVDRKIDVSNLALVIENNQTSRIKIEILEDKKTRIYKKNMQPVVKQILEDIKNKQ